MSDRDDDGYNSPEGKGSSEEEQRRKAALAQLTVDGGSDESGPPKPFDMKETIEKEKKVKDFNEFLQKLRTKDDNNGPLEIFRYEGDALKPLMKVETFKDHKSNVIEFERYAKRSLEAVQGANKKVVDLSDYLNVNSGAVSALREAIGLFRKEWGKDDRKLTDEHYEKYGQLLYMMEEGMNMPARDIDTMEGNFLWTYAKEVYKYRDQYVSKFLEDAAIGNDALVLQLNALRDNPEQIIRTGQDWETTLLGANGLAAAMMDAFYDADKVTVSPEQEMNLRRKIEAFTLDFKEVPSHAKILPGQLLLDIKTKDGKIDKLKSRFVLRGDLSRKGVEYFESASHKVRGKTIRSLYAMAAVNYARTKKGSYIPRFADVKTAFLTRKRRATDPELYSLFPEWSDGLLPDKHGPTCGKLMTNLYGAQDGSRMFEAEMLDFMDSIGAEALVTDRMCFRWKWSGETMRAAVHVDDCIHNGSNDAILDEFYRRMVAWFEACVGNTRADFVLGLRVDWDLDKGTVKLSQRAHAEKLLKEFRYDPNTITTSKTPFPGNVTISAEENGGTQRRIPTSEFDYFKFVGFLNWLAISTRVDLSGAVGVLGRYSSRPLLQHVQLAKHVMRYIGGTMDVGLTYHGSKEDLQACEGYDMTNRLLFYCDADHGACLDTGRSTSCVIGMMNGAAIIWSSRRQRVNTTSTAHSEMIALASGVMEIEWARDLLQELGYPQGTVKVMEDNSATLSQSSGDYKSSKSDHYRRTQFYVEDAVNQGKVWIDKCMTTDMLADLGLKQVWPAKQFEYLRDRAMGTTLGVPLSNTVKDILAGRR